MLDTGAEHYSGNSSYAFINKLISNRDKELMIVSPYIGNHYTRKLLKEAGRKRIRIITSESSLRYPDSMLKGLHNNGLGGYLSAILYFLVLDAIVVYLRFFYIVALVTILLLLTVYATAGRRRRIEKNIELRTTGSELVHEKLYITDSMAIVGSANLTYNGTHRNIEHIEVIRNRQEIDELKRHFISLWNQYR